MNKRKISVTVALLLGVVLLIGFQTLAAAGAPNKSNKHLSAKVPAQMDSYKLDKHLALKTYAFPQRTALGAWLVTPVVVVGMLLAPWTVRQVREMRRMIQCTRKLSYF